MNPHGHHPQHHQGRGRGPITPLGRYLRAKLQRRLFVWFGLSILVTACVVGVAMFALSRIAEPGWMKELQQVQRFVGRQFERVWDLPAERDELASYLSTAFEAGVHVRDAKGNLLAGFGEPCRRRRPIVARVERRDRIIGSVALCPQHSGPRQGWRFFVPLILAIGVLWAASGKLARRLVRPLAELAKVVQSIGSGDLKARAQLSKREPDEIGVVAVAVNDMAERIEKQMADQRELLASVSHELRTPLARIRILNEMGRQSATPKLFDELDREVMEMDSLVGELLANSRLDFSALALTSLEPATIAARALERTGIESRALVADAGLPNVKADPTLLMRALINIIDNAKKHGRGLETLTIRAALDGGVSFSALDRGQGIPPGEEQKIFEPFRRQGGTGAAEAERSEGSLGLGLTLVERIAQAHGGSVFARNRPEGGAEVGFVLPTFAPR